MVISILAIGFTLLISFLFSIKDNIRMPITRIVCVYFSAARHPLALEIVLEGTSKSDYRPGGVPIWTI